MLTVCAKLIHDTVVSDSIINCFPDMKQHAVPENIMEVEFKLFGSLTAKQFGYIIAGGLLGLFLYYTFKGLGSNLLAIMFAVLSGVLGISLALVRINEQPFEVWLGNFLAAMFSSQKRVWKKEKKVPESLSKSDKKSATIDRQQVVPVMPAVVQTPVPPQSVQGTGVQQQTNTLPNHPFKALDQQNNQTTQPQDPSVPSPNYDVSSLAGQVGGSAVQSVPGSAQGAVNMTSNQEPRPLNMSSVSDGNAQPTQSAASGAVLHRAPSTIGAGQQLSTNSNNQVVQEPKLSQPVTGDEDSNLVNPVNQQIQDSQISYRQGDISKADQFRDVVPGKEEILTEGGSDVPTTSDTPVNDEIDDENKALRERLVEYSEERQKLEEELTTTKKGYDELRSQNEQILKQLENLGKELSNIKQQPQPQNQISTLPPMQSIPTQVVMEDTVGDTGLFAPRVYSGPSLSKKPNVVSGIVKTKDGKLLPGVVVIVKDPGVAHPRPIRAMKTNSLGQFITTSAIEENGVYVIELSKSGFTFGRYEIELKGDVLPTYEFIAD